MLIESFGYLGVRSDRLDEWAGFGTTLLGLQLAERGGSELRFRMDDHAQRLCVSSRPDAENHYGWQVHDAAALQSLAARLEAAGAAVTPMDAALRQARAVTDGIVFRDPAGHRLEAFHGPLNDGRPFVSGRPISGFRTGSLGMGHVVFHVARIAPVRHFYEQVLGFAVSDYCTEPFGACFFHLNSRHHSLALIETGRQGLHHVMMELLGLDDVGQAYDIALADPGRIGTTLGRHTNDFMTSFYARTPDDFMVEYGWGGRAIDPATWQAVEMKHGPSLWGHERTWLPPDQMAQARAFRAKAAAEGLRAPVQVTEGDYVVVPRG